MPRRLNWRQIADDFADRIRLGEYRPGDKIPSYTEIEALYGVSYSTAVRAVREMRHRGMVYGEQGRGVYVRGPGA